MADKKDNVEKLTINMREGFLESLLLLIQAPFFAAKTAKEIKIAYREVQLDLTPEIEEFHMMFERCHTKKIEGDLS